MPTPMTAQNLVDAVKALRTDAKPLVEAGQIISWCQGRSIDVDDPNQKFNNGYFMDADNDEARGAHRLQKYKKANDDGDCPKTAPNAWALISDVNADAYARTHGWCKVLWKGTPPRWAWDGPDCRIP